MIRVELRLILETEPDLRVVAEAADGESALAQTASAAPDIVLMDLHMPGMGGIEAIARPDVSGARWADSAQ